MQSLCFYHGSSGRKSNKWKRTYIGCSTNGIASAYAIFCWQQTDDGRTGNLSCINMVTIIPYEEKYQPDFKRLNLEWLDHYDLTESHDLVVLNDPTGKVLDHGGFIWLAKEQDEIVGTIGLINEGNGIFELAKMSVAKNWQGKGISRLLMETCLNKAREIGAKKLSDRKSTRLNSSHHGISY